MAYTVQVGAIRCHILSDGLHYVDGGGFFGLVPRLMWERVIEPTPSVAEQQLTVPGLRAGFYLCFFGVHVLTPHHPTDLHLGHLETASCKSLALGLPLDTRSVPMRTASPQASLISMMSLWERIPLITIIGLSSRPI